MDDLRLRLIIDGEEGIATIKLTETEYDKLFNKFKLFPGFPPTALTSIKALQVELLKTSEATDETAEATAEFIRYYAMSEAQIEQVVQALREEQRQLAQGSAEYKQHTTALLNISNAQRLLQSSQAQVTTGSNAARMAVGQFGYALGDAGMIAVDFRMFLLSIGNNFPFIIQGLAQVSKEAEEAKMSMGSFLKNNIDASMKMVLGANALMLALQILPAIFNKINEESGKAAAEGMKNFTDQLKNMTSGQIIEKLNEVKNKLKEIREEEDKRKKETLSNALIPASSRGLFTNFSTPDDIKTKDEAGKTRFDYLTDEEKKILEARKSRKLALELEIADYDKLIDQVKKGANADAEILRLRNEQAIKQKELNDLLLTTEERAKKQKEDSDKQKQEAEKKKQQYDEYISKVIQQYELTKKLNEFEKQSNVENIFATQKLISAELTRNISLENRIKLLELQKKLELDLNAGIDIYADAEADLEADFKKQDDEFSASERYKTDQAAQQIEARKKLKELQVQSDISSTVDQFERERKIARNEANNQINDVKEDYNLGLISKEEFENSKFLIEQEYARKSRELDQQSFQYKLGMMSQIVDTFANAYNQIYSAMESNVSKELNTWEEKEQKKLDQERKAALQHARTQAQRDRINEQYNKKEQQLEQEKQKRAEEKLAAWFEFQKVVNIAQATSNTALAATEALASAPPPWNYALMAAVIAAGMGQVAVIASQQFPGYAQGGRLSKGQAGYIEGWHNEIIAPEQTFETIMRQELIPRVINNVGSDPGLLNEMKKFNENMKIYSERPIQLNSKKVVSSGLARIRESKL